MPDELDGEHEHHQGEGIPFMNGAEEVAEVCGEAVLFDADDMGRDEDHQGGRRRGVEIVGRREEARDKGQDITKEDKDGDGANEGEEALGVLLTHLVGHERHEGVEDQFKEGPRCELAIGFSAEVLVGLEHEEARGAHRDKREEDMHEAQGLAFEEADWHSLAEVMNTRDEVEPAMDSVFTSD